MTKNKMRTVCLSNKIFYTWNKSSRIGAKYWFIYVYMFLLERENCSFDVWIQICIVRCVECYNVNKLIVTNVQRDKKNLFRSKLLISNVYCKQKSSVFYTLFANILLLSLLSFKREVTGSKLNTNVIFA